MLVEGTEWGGSEGGVGTDFHLTSTRATKPRIEDVTAGTTLPKTAASVVIETTALEIIELTSGERSEEASLKSEKSGS